MKIETDDKHILSEAKLRILERASRNIPPIQQRDAQGNKLSGEDRQLLGSDLIAAGIMTMHGEDVKPGNYYTMRRPVLERHLFNLLNAYKENGDKGVEEYLKKMKRYAWEDAIPRQKIFYLLRQIARSFRLLFNK